jgi:trigger factor
MPRRYTPGSVKSVLEPLEGNKVKLSIEVDEAEFDRDVDNAFRKIAREVRLPGFRPGKAPRRLLEAHLGPDAARQQALQDGIPGYLAKAVREHDVDLIATPKVEITGGADEGPVAFDAECEVRPEVTVPGYGGLRVELPSVEASDEEIDKAIDIERRRHGSLADVDRPAATGDQVTLNLSASRDGEAVAGLNTDDWLYEIGKGWVAEGFDDRLVGASAGDELAFSAVPSGTTEEADFAVTVTKVQETLLPEISDEWVSDNLGEFDTVAEWHDSIRERVSTGKLNQARNVLFDRVAAALSELVDEEPPEALVTGEQQRRVQGFVRQLQSQGIAVEQWLAATGQDPASFVEGMKEQAVRGVKVDLALRAIAKAEAMEVTDDDVEVEYQRIAIQVGQKVNQVRKAYEKNDAVADLIAQMRTSKAMEWLLHRAELVDENGKAISNDLILGHSLESHDHDDDHEGHDHDHDHGDTEEAS